MASQPLFSLIRKVSLRSPKVPKKVPKGVPAFQGSHLCLGLHQVGNFAKREDKKQRLRLRMRTLPQMDGPLEPL